MKKQQPIFIVSSGRTGSTLISRILNNHKKICIISDLIEPVGDNRFFEDNKKVSSFEFFNLISRRTSLSRIYYWRKKKTKELLYLPKEDNNISCLNCYTIPFVFKNVPKTFNELKKKFSNRNNCKKKSEHLANFFEFFKNKAKKKIYVERTGGALHHIDKILKFYPNSKIVLNLRDPIETAISMRNYPFFRMYELMQNKKYLDKWDFIKKKKYSTYGKMLDEWYKVFFFNKKKIKNKNFYFYNYEDLLSNPEKTLKDLILFITDEKKENQYLKKFSKKFSKMIKPNVRKVSYLNKKSILSLEKSLNYTLKNIKKLKANA